MHLTLHDILSLFISIEFIVICWKAMMNKAKANSKTFLIYESFGKFLNSFFLEIRVAQKAFHRTLNYSPSIE